MKKYNYENLEIYALANNIAIAVYELTRSFPKDEIFGIISQLRRASVSIVLNIVEGYTRSSKKDFAMFIERSIGSTAEVRAALQLSISLGFIEQSDANDIFILIDEEYFKLQKFKKYLRS